MMPENRRKNGEYKMKKVAVCICLLLLPLCLVACSNKDTAMTENEKAALYEVIGEGAQTSDITAASLKDDISRENPSVKKIHLTDEGQYVFFASPIGYNGPIDMMLIIDRKTAETTAMRILRHYETEHYVRDMESPWFVDRFAGQSVFTYLVRVKLDAAQKNEIVAITGSTVTTDAIVEGVNDCFDVFRTIDNPHYEEAVGNIDVYDGEKLVGTLTIDDLRTLDIYRRQLVIHSSMDGDTTHDFRGVRLSDAIGLLDSELLRKSGSISAVGTDGYAAEVGMEEVLMENNVYIMFEDYDKPIQSISGKDGALRLIILNDDFGQRFANYLKEIRFENGE